ncbi:MAG: M28 family peptidase [Gemmatimonadota bacterium]
MPRATFPPALVALGLTAALGSWSCTTGAEELSVDQALDEIPVEGFLAHMNALSADAMSGRRPGTAGYDSAAAYVAREARALGLEPGGTDGSYMQPIRFRRAVVEPGSETLVVNGTGLVAGVDFAVAPQVAVDQVAMTAPLVFAGFGIHAPDLGYDDLAGLDLDGALVVVLPGAPEALGSLERTVLGSSAARDRELRARGALGVVTVQGGGDTEAPWSSLVRRAARPRVDFLAPEAEGGPDGSRAFASLYLSRARAAEWVAGTGRDLEAVEAALRAGEPESFPLDADVRLEARFSHEPFESANVVALLPGSDPTLADEHLVLTAHLDHLGVGAVVEGDSIYNGTLDNASGSSALLTLASVLTRMAPPRRSIAFVWVTAEESGLLGSEYFARFPSVAPGRIVANQNIDGVMGMITASSDVLAFGYEHSNLSEAVDAAVARTGTPVSPDPTPEENLFIRSDQYAFVRNGIPAIWVQGGRTGARPGLDPQADLDAWIAERYHQPDDDPKQPMDLDGVRVELRANLLVAHYIANELGPVRWRDDSFLYRRFHSP